MTLIHAGWVALGSSDADFVATETGKEANSHSRPTTLLIARPNPATVVMEQVTGAVVHSSQVSYTLRRKLAEVPTKATILPTQVHDTTLDIGQVQHLLPSANNEWIRWIDPDIGIRSSGAHCVLADLDTWTGRVQGLPRVFVEALEPHLRKHAGDGLQLSRPLTTGTHQEPVVRPTKWNARADNLNLIAGTDEHASLAQRAFAEAVSRVLITSAFVSSEALQALAPHVSAAMARGVDIDLLWGYESGPAGLVKLEALASELEGDQIAGRLRFNRAPSRSHMKVLIWDDPSGWRAVIGSHNWLSAYRAIPLVDISIELSSGGVVGTIARHAASIWAATPGESLSAVPNCWQTVAADIDRVPAPEPLAIESKNTEVEISLVYGRSHEIELRKAMRSSRQRLLIASHKVSKAGLTRLQWGTDVEREPSFEGVVLFDELLEDTQFEDAHAAADAGSCRVLRQPVHAKILVSDHSVLIGSYNYLAADPAGCGSRIRELSVKVDDAGFAGMVLRRVLDSLAINSPGTLV